VAARILAVAATAVCDAVAAAPPESVTEPARGKPAGGREPAARVEGNVITYVNGLELRRDAKETGDVVDLVHDTVRLKVGVDVEGGDVMGGDVEGGDVAGGLIGVTTTLMSAASAASVVLVATSVKAVPPLTS